MAPIAGLLLASPLPSPSINALMSQVRNYEAAHPGHTMIVAQVLEGLPEAYRASFSLMHTSRSLQSSSPEAPRAILFGEDGRTIIAFNGHAEQTGFNHLEVASVTDDDAIEFRRIEFPPGDTGVGQTHLSQANPPTCMACHGPTVHFIWGFYPTWPGAFGSRDDALDLPNWAPNDRRLDHEGEHFGRLRANAAASSRYRTLIFDPERIGSTAPYRPLLSTPRHGGLHRSDYLPAVEARPNLRLGSLLVRHQARVRANALMRAPNFARYRYGLLYSLADCADGDPAGEALYQHDGVRRPEDYAVLMGDDPDLGWHLEMGPFSAYGVDDFNGFDGFAAFKGYLLSALLARGFADDGDVAAMQHPVPLAEIFRASELTLGSRGQRLWEGIDAAGVLTLAFDTVNFATPIVPNRPRIDTLADCATLASKQLRTR